MKEEFVIKRGKYKSSRGGCSRFLNLHCRNCNNLVAVCQKVGSGNFIRLYLDRIMVPEKLVGLQNNSVRDVQTLKCDECGLVIGIPYIYQKEKKKCFSSYSKCDYEKYYEN